MAKKHGFSGTPVRPNPRPSSMTHVFDKRGDIGDYREQELREVFKRNLETENPDFDQYEGLEDIDFYGLTKGTKQETQRNRPKKRRQPPRAVAKDPPPIGEGRVISGKLQAAQIMGNVAAAIVKNTVVLRTKNINQEAKTALKKEKETTGSLLQPRVHLFASNGVPFAELHPSKGSKRYAQPNDYTMRFQQCSCGFRFPDTIQRKNCPSCGK